MATLTERFATLTVENLRLTDMLRNVPERCATLAESEPEPVGDIPAALKTMTLEDAIRATVRTTKMSIANRIREDFNITRDTVAVHVAYAQIPNEYGALSDGVILTCSRCNFSVSLRGTTERSIRLGCKWLRDRCPRKESNFYTHVEEERHPTFAEVLDAQDRDRG